MIIMQPYNEYRPHGVFHTVALHNKAVFSPAEGDIYTALGLTDSQTCMHNTYIQKCTNSSKTCVHEPGSSVNCGKKQNLTFDVGKAFKRRVNESSLYDIIAPFDLNKELRIISA